LIYICIPTHNEQQTVGVVLWKLRQVLTEFPRDYQLLVADDASTDRTQDVLEPYTRVLPLTVVRTETRQGYAASLEMLLREATRRSEYPKRDVIVTLQADFSEEPDDLVPLLKRLEAGADVAAGMKVSASKEPRTRRLARALSGFFVRGQQWPEAVVTPFDGYRAYRLYAVKRAIEERDGRRLLRYDGWAGHAELLRAVLPHARRVDAVTVEDRSDRMQRPRRERPLLSALQVRAMMRDVEPGSLVSVAELDRIAATGSRARDRGLVLNGAGNGARRPAGERDRSESRARGARSGQGDGARRRPSRPQQDATAEGQRKQKPRTRPARKPKDAELDAATSPETQAAVAPLDGDATAAPKPKRKRRRRRRSTGTAATADTQAGADVQDSQPPGEAQGTPVVAGATDGDPDGASDGGDGADGTGVRKRRRRGGRRGGRGRRKNASEAQGTDSDSEGGPTEPAATAGTQPAAESRSDQE
jgi:hypothetical protein